MGAHSQNQKRFRRSWNMRPHLFLLPLASLVSPLLCQLKFSGGVSSSSSNSNSNSPNRNTNNRPTDVDEKFFLGGDTPSLTGNQALDGGIVGLGLGALGAATATSRTRASTTRTRLSTTRIPGGASATTASPSATRTGTHTGRARGGTTRGGPGATPPVGTTTAAIFRGPTDSKTIPGRTGRAAIKADQELCGAVVFKQ